MEAKLRAASRRKIHGKRQRVNAPIDLVFSNSLTHEVYLVRAQSTTSCRRITHLTIDSRAALHSQEKTVGMETDGLQGP